MVFFFFFFFKQTTAYEIRPCDWSSDVCSSDLRFRLGQIVARTREHRPSAGGPGWRPAAPEDRKSVVKGKSVRSCVDLGGGRNIKKKKLLIKLKQLPECVRMRLVNNQQDY